MGLSVSYISKIENGGSDPDSELLKKFAKALDVSPADFFAEQEGKFIAHFTQVAAEPDRRAKTIRLSMHGDLTERERERIEELLSDLLGLPDDEKSLIFDIIETVIRRNPKRG